MVVRFPLNPAGSASYVVTDTDYTNYAMVCTCQDLDIFVTHVHRVSCSRLQRTPQEDVQITEKLKNTVPEKYLHDFDKIKHDGCEYEREKSWQKQLAVLPVMRNLTLKIIHQLVMKRRTQLSLSFLATSKVLESRTGENPTDFRSVRNFIPRCRIRHTYKHIGWGFTTYVLSATNLLNSHWLKSDACLSINIH